LPALLLFFLKFEEMAGVIIMNIIGVLSGGLGIIQFGMDNFATPNTVGSTLNFAYALNYDGSDRNLSNADGDLPDVLLFNETGIFLGMKADRGYGADGATNNVKVDHDENNEQ
jgi:hypothetical protein